MGGGGGEVKKIILVSSKCYPHPIFQTVARTARSRQSVRKTTVILNRILDRLLRRTIFWLLHQRTRFRPIFLDFFSLHDILPESTATACTTITAVSVTGSVA